MNDISIDKSQSQPSSSERFLVDSDIDPEIERVSSPLNKGGEYDIRL